MKIIGCDLHASQQSIAMLDRDASAVIEKTLRHEGETIGERNRLARPDDRL